MKDILKNLNLASKEGKQIVKFIFICLGLFFMIIYQLKAVNPVKKNIAKLNNDINILIRDQEALKAIKQSQAQREASKMKEIISEADIPLLLQDITNTANKYSIEILQINSSKDSRPVEDKAMQAQRIYSRTITLDLVSNYHSLGAFINDLENSKKLIAVATLKISRESGVEVKQKVNLVIKAYVRR